MTKNGQSVCELCERKEKVCRSVGHIQTRASTGLVVNDCAVSLSLKGNYRMPDMLRPTPPETRYLCRPPFWSYGTKYASMTVRESQWGACGTLVGQTKWTRSPGDGGRAARQLTVIGLILFYGFLFSTVDIGSLRKPRITNILMQLTAYIYMVQI